MAEPTPEEQLNQLVCGYWHSQAVYVAAKLGIADLLSDGPLPAEELASLSGTHGPSLFRLLRALASLGVFSQESDGRFSLTPAAELLKSDVPGSHRAMAIMMGEEHYLAWGRLIESVRTGETTFEALYDKPIFEFLAENPEQAATFDQAMVSVHGRETAGILAAYDFSNFSAIADIGGGNGSMLCEILADYPDLHATLYDLPGVIDRAGRNVEKAGLSERIHLVDGDFFESVPAGADAYLLRHIIHDWDDDRAIRILENVHRAMDDDGRLLVLESVIPPGNEPFLGKLLDLTMMVIPGGRERTEIEYAQILGAAGFRLARIVPTNTEVSVIEGLRE